MCIGTIKQGGSDCEVKICFGTKFKLSVDLTVIVSDIDFGIYLTSLSLMICRIASSELAHSCLYTQIRPPDRV